MVFSLVIIGFLFTKTGSKTSEEQSTAFGRVF